LTGEYGMLNFSRAIKAEIQSSGWIPNFADMTLKKQAGPNSNVNFGYGFQYVEYYLPNGGSVTMVHNPLFDDKDIYTEIDPITGYPVKSQEMVFLDIVGDGNENNVLLLEQKNSFEFAYICGLHSPYNLPTQKSTTHQAAHAGEYYEMHMSKLQGVAIRDVTRCGVYQVSQN
jgi:hypothetical protein